jgi:hypothetical protein
MALDKNRYFAFSLGKLESAWTQHASLTPQRAITHGDEAHAVFRASTTGVVRVVVRIENMTRETTIAVSSPPDLPRGM